jgi:Flp pilus assembly protein TadG
MTNLVNRFPLWQTVRRFALELRGAAAIEFAIIVPVLAVIVLMISDASNVAVGGSRMESALRSSVQYVMNGGVDMAQAQAVGLQAWQGKPSNATLSVSSVCKCGSGAGICGQICSDGSLPQTFVTATATGKLGGSVIHIQKTLGETIRVH